MGELLERGVQGGREPGCLTRDDELNRWHKCAFGCNKLLSIPMPSWFSKGPITRQMRTFVCSDAPVHYKLSMMSYMSSYYGLAIALPLSLLNYFMLGFALDIDGFYLHSFEI